MSYPNPQLPPTKDPLGQALHLLRLTGTLYCRSTLTAPWGIAIPDLGDLMTFQLITEGQCWLTVAGQAPRFLRKGDLTLIPHGTPHSLSDDLRTPTTPLFDIPVEKLSDRYEVLRHGGGGAVTSAMYGVMRVDHVAAHRLIALLPKVMQIDSWDTEIDGWLTSTLHLIAREAASLRPGGETIITRLADIVVIQAIRAWIDRAPEARQGWLAALRDPHIGPALAAMQSQPAHDWTLVNLAVECGMSRSAFAARFAQLVGEPPMHYLTHWRMQLADMHLRQSGQSISQIADGLGYRSEAAFCRAFKRVHGHSPGQARRLMANAA